MNPKHSYRCTIQCCGSGSGRIRIILPDPDRNQFQANEKVEILNFFLENFNMLAEILKIMTHLTLMRKIKLCKWQCSH
jgi:hypothetical protein